MILNHKIDFAVIIVAEHCNPNGDPNNGNMPRQGFDGFGEISDVCIKRKIRDRLQDGGEEILMQKADEAKDGCHSALERIKQYDEFKKYQKGKDKNQKEFKRVACEKWIDVRSFGQIFMFKGEEGISSGIRGPVSVGAARTISVVNICIHDITKSLNLETNEKNPDLKGPDTMGRKYFIDKGVYVCYGSIFPQLAELTGFTTDDAEKIKTAIVNLLENDASAARPSGSMVAHRIYWWEHNSKSGQYNSAKVHHSLKIKEQDVYPYYSVEVEELAGINPEIICNG